MRQAHSSLPSRLPGSLIIDMEDFGGARSSKHGYHPLLSALLGSLLGSWTHYGKRIRSKILKRIGGVVDISQKPFVSVLLLLDLDLLLSWVIVDNGNP